MESSSLGGEGARGGGACRVCGDKASGKHYGVASCDGCRGFFKRSIRRNLDYVCKDNNECVVDVTRRNQCQACRFSKCLRVNMRKDAVQHERAPRSGLQSQLALKLGYAGRHFPAPAPYLPPFRLPELDAFHVGPLAHPYRLPLFSAPLHYPLGAPGYFPANVFYPSPLPALHRAFPVAGVMERGAIPESSRERSPEGSLNAEGSGKLEEEEVTSSEEAFNTLTAGAAARKDFTAGRPSLLRRESPVAPVITVADYQKPSPAKMPRFESAETERQKSQLPRPELSRPANDRDLSCMLGQRVNEYAAKVLLISVQWSRSLPSFLQLSQRDQETLLLSSWKELFILTAAHYSVHLDEEQFTSQLMGNRPDLREEARGLAALVSRVVRMRLDHTEYTCLKAMVLFRSESLQSGVSTVVEFLQEQSLGTLQKHCASHPTGARFGRLLLLLPAVSCLASQAGLQRLIFTSTLADVETVLSRLMRAPNN